jgi:hypothetical protein
MFGPLRLLGIELHEARRIVDLAARLGYRLALLQRHDPREVLAMLPHQFEPAPQAGRALLRQEPGPVRPGGMRGVHRRARLRRGQGRHVAEPSAIGRIGDRDRRAIRRGGPFPAEIGEVPDKARILHLGKRRAGQGLVQRHRTTSGKGDYPKAYPGARRIWV